MFKIADTLLVDPAVFRKNGKRTCAIGQTGSGKTNVLAVQAEEWFLQGWAATIVDPNGQLRKLKEQGFPVLLAGNRPDKDDLIVTLDNAAALAEFSFQHRVSVILDTSNYEPGEDFEVVAAYLDRLWRLIRTQDDESKFEPYALILDEAQLFIPQSGITATTKTINDMSKRGRHYLLSILGATQRPATIQKDFWDSADLVFWMKLRGRTLDFAAEGLSMSVREVREIMKPFAHGMAVISDAFEFIGNVDYQIVQVRPRRGLEMDNNTPQPVAATGLRPLDKKLLEGLRKAMQVESKRPTKAPSGVAVQLDMSSVLESKLAAEQVEKQKLRAHYASLMMATYQEMAGLRKQLAMADNRIEQLKAHPVIVEPVAQKPMAIPALAMAVDEDIEYSVTTRTETYRSSRSIKMAMGRQQGAFETLLERIQNLRPMHRRILAVAMDTNKQTGISIRELMVKLDYSEGRVKGAAADLFKMGLLMRGVDTRTYQNNVESMLRQRYPDLDQDDLIHQLWENILEEA